MREWGRAEPPTPLKVSHVVMVPQKPLLNLPRQGWWEVDRL